MKSHCNNCGGEREHIALHEHTEKGKEQIEDGYSFDWATRSWVLRCAGCGSLSFRTDDWNSAIHDGEGNELIETKYYPPRIFRQQPIWLRNAFLSDCPVEIEKLLNEAYICMQNACPRTAAMAIRAALERIMIQKVGDNGSFSKNLEEFQKNGFLAAKQREIIEPVLEAGHASIHRGYVPSTEDIVLLFDVTETLVEFVYIHGAGVSALKGRLPKRK